MTAAPASRLELPAIARALRVQAEVSSLVCELGRLGIPVLGLKGPALQQRLYRTPAAYASGDVDLLVPRDRARLARRALVRAGWRFERENGVLWFLSRAATYARDGVRVDLHWGVHAAHLPSWTLRPLERALWVGALPGVGGLLEPDAESLFVFLAVHAVGHGFQRAAWSENVAACARLVRDWDRVWRLAHDARVERAVAAALAPERGAPPVLGGLGGRVVSGATWLVRGHFIPRRVRDVIRRVVAAARPAPVERYRFAGLELIVEPGVFPPQAVTEGLVRLGQRAVGNRPRPIVVDVGTGSGAVALAFASRRRDAEVHATDTSVTALDCARRNRDRLALHRVQLHAGSLLEALPTELRARCVAVLANVPYVPPALAEENGRWRSLIEGPGPDGLDCLRALAREARRFLEPGGWLVLQLADVQCDPFQQELVSLGYEHGGVEERRTGKAVIAWAVWPGGAAA